MNCIIIEPEKKKIFFFRLKLVKTTKYRTKYGWFEIYILGIKNFKSPSNN